MVGCAGGGSALLSGAVLRRVLLCRDALLTAALIGLGEAELFSGEQYNRHPVWPGPRWFSATLIVLLVLPLAWRRRRPLASVVAVISIGGISTLVVGAPESVTSFVVLIATAFAGAAYSRHWMVVAAAAALWCAARAFHDPAAQGVVDLFWGFGLVAISLLLGRALYARQHRIGSLERDARLAAGRHAQQLAAASAAERAAIAREIHDLVSHAVSVIVVQAQAGTRALPDDPHTAGAVLSRIEDSARSAMTELRRLLLVLDDGEPAAVDPAVSVAVLPQLIDRCRAAGLRLTVDLPAAWPRLAASTDAAAYHLVREALTNTMRHASGARVDLRVTVQPSMIEVTVTDTGPADPLGNPAATAGVGRGLVGMRERVSLVGGRLEVGPFGAGYRVQAWLPRAGPAGESDPAGAAAFVPVP